MIDIARFMQDGVGLKKRQYEISIVTVTGYQNPQTFTANGDILVVFGGVKDGKSVGYFQNLRYVFTPDSTVSSNLIVDRGSTLSITYNSARSITHTVSSYPDSVRTIAIISERR